VDGILSFLVGFALGIIALGEIVRLMWLSGRITTTWIAEQCDRLIDANDEPSEPSNERSPKGPGTL
jgi:hypothetical protein